MTDKPSPYDTLRGAYADTGPDERRRRKVASGYRPNPHYERLLSIREHDPATWGKLDQTTRAGVALYEGAKRAHEEQEAAR